MFKFIFWINIIFSLYLFSTGVCVKGENVDPSFVIQVNDGLMTAKVKRIPLEKVLAKVTEQIPLRVVPFVSGEELINADFSGLSIEKGLIQLLRDFNYSFVFGPEQSKSRGPEVRKVFIISRKEPVANSDEEPESHVIPEGHSLESLGQLLKDKDSEIREEAVDSLGKLKDADSIELLTEALLNDADEDVRMSAADALAVIRDQSAIDSLKAALNDESTDVRMSAADALGAIGSKEAIGSLNDTLHDSDPIVRESAVEALGQIGGDKAIQALITALSDEDEDVRETATEIIDWLQGK